MSVASAAWDARAPRRVVAAAIAVALQGVFYFLILHETIEKEAPPGPTPLEVILFNPPARLRSAKSAPRHVRPAPPRPALHGRTALQIAPPVVPQPIRSPAGRPAPHAPIDWQRSIQSEVEAEESPSRPKKLNFGFPQAPRGPGALTEFGWDYAHTHRIVPLPHGGMIINLSDRCSINLWFPIPLCQFGKQPANGHLFDDLKGPWNDRTDGLP